MKFGGRTQTVVSVVYNDGSPEESISFEDETKANIFAGWERLKPSVISVTVRGSAAHATSDTKKIS